MLFIPETDLAKAVLRFRKLYDQIPNAHLAPSQYQRFYLGYAKATFDSVSAEFGIRRLVKGARAHRSLLQSALALIAQCRGASQQQVCKELDLDDHTWRKWGVELLRDWTTKRNYISRTSM